MTQKVKKNQKDIKRIEKILYKNDKYTQKKPLLVKQSQDILAFQDKIKALNDKRAKAGIMTSRQSECISVKNVAQNLRESEELMAADAISLGKAFRMEQIDRQNRYVR